MTDLEDALVWQLHAIGITPGMVREHRFAPPRRWRFDLAWPGLAIAVEVEGGSWVHGGHNRGADFERNAEKYNEAAIRGWCLIRVTTTMIKDGRAAQVVERAVRSRLDRELTREFQGRGDD